MVNALLCILIEHERDITEGGATELDVARQPQAGGRTTPLC